MFFMEKEGDYEVETLELKPEEQEFLGRKTRARFGIAHQLRFPLIWVIFFTIIGIVIQSIIAGRFVFLEFFGSNYVNWFRDFGSFVDPTAYESAQQLFYSIWSRLYYFFYTGGLIALIWEFISWAIHSEVRLIGKEKRVQHIKKQDIEEPEEKTQAEKIDELLFKGQKLLLEEEKPDAMEIYEELQKIYDPKKDENKEQYQKILDFYNILTKDKKKTI